MYYISTFYIAYYNHYTAINLYRKEKVSNIQNTRKHLRRTYEIRKLNFQYKNCQSLCIGSFYIGFINKNRDSVFFYKMFCS